jgi:serine protease Do
VEPVRPSVSRETRLLLTVVLVALAMLWVLARIRFPDGPPSPSPVPPVLAQLAPQPVLDDLSASVAQVEPRIGSSLAIVDELGSPLSRRGAAEPSAVALRWRDNLGILVADPAAESQVSDSPDSVILAIDPATSLAVVRVPYLALPSLPAWMPRRLDGPRFLIAADAVPGGVSLRPVFIGALSAVESALWSGDIWMLPPHTELSPGSFVFTTDGAPAGLVTQQGGRLALVPPDLLVDHADRLLESRETRRGVIGVDVMPLTPDLSAAIGAVAGIAVVSVDADGPAAGRLRPTDVIEQVDGTPVQSIGEWNARVARLTEGQEVALRVRRADEVREVRLTAEPPVADISERSLGLTVRTIGRVGVEVLRVDPGSAGARAGLRAGDVITVAGDRQAPSAAELRRAFTLASDDRPLAVAVTRGDTHLLLVIEKTW